MKVYVITSGEYSSYCIRAVALSREKELKIEFGYDIDGNGNIEWLPEIVSYLDSWNSNDISVEFKATSCVSEGMERTEGNSTEKSNRKME